MAHTSTKLKRHTIAKHNGHHKKKATRNISDMDKLKAYLWDTTHQLRTTTGDTYEAIRDKTDDMQDYLGERPFKTVGVSIVTGLVAGVFIGYFINRE